MANGQVANGKSAGAAWIEAPRTAIATVGVRTFTDETVPPGTPSVQYMIRGIRGDKVGLFSEAVTVYLGKTPMNGEEGGLSLAA